MPYCQANNVTILAYSPMAQGILTGKFGPQHRFEKGDHRARHRLFQPDMLARVQQALERLRPIAQRQGVTLAQLALAWVISHPDTCAIAGARSAAQAAENAHAGDIVLAPEVLAEMDAVSRSVTDHLDGNPVQWNF
jgi:aryl-alcohol dehydrogenase-like predicted oxidoreductase